MRGVLGGNAVGLVLTLGPQAYVDARATGLFSNPTSQEAWTQFAIASAKNQSGNLAGVAASVAGGALVVGVTAAFAVTVGAPIVIAVGLLAGIGGQSLFNAFGLDDRSEEAARWLLGR